MKRILTSVFIAIVLSLQCLPVMAELVMYNTKTGKYHGLTCPYAKKCTVNCIKIEKSEAIKRGGIQCKVCGGK